MGTMIDARVHIPAFFPPQSLTRGRSDGLSSVGRAATKYEDSSSFRVGLVVRRESAKGRRIVAVPPDTPKVKRLLNYYLMKWHKWNDFSKYYHRPNLTL